MAIRTILFYTFLRQVRDWKVMIALVVLPLFAIAILGFADNNFTQRTIGPMKLGVVTGGEPTVTDALHRVLQTEPAAYVQAETIDTLEHGIDLVKAGELEGLLSIQPPEVHYYGQSDRSLAMPIIDSFVRSVNLAHALHHSWNDEASSGLSGADAIREIQLSSEGSAPRSIDYYSMTMTLQFLLYGALTGVFAVTKDFGNHTYARLLTSPIRRRHIALGKLIGTVFALYAVALLIYAVTRFGYQADWSGNTGIILSVLFLFCVVSASVGMAVAYASRSTMMSALFVVFYTMAVSVVSGGFSPMEGEIFRILSQFTPNGHAQDTWMSTIFDQTVDYSSFGKLALYAAITTTLALILGRRKLA